jgi:hypothetical protein
MPLALEDFDSNYESSIVRMDTPTTRVMSIHALVSMFGEDCILKQGLAEAAP